ERLAGGQCPNVQHSMDSFTVGITLRQNDPAVDHDGAVPVAPPAGQRREALAGRCLIHIEATMRRIDEQEIVGLEWARPTYAVAPYLTEHSTLDPPGRGTAVVRREHPGLIAVPPHCRLGEWVG